MWVPQVPLLGPGKARNRKNEFILSETWQSQHPANRSSQNPRIVHALFGDFARLPPSFELIAGIPLDRLCLIARQPTQHKPKPRQLRVAAKIPVGAVFVGGL